MQPIVTIQSDHRESIPAWALLQRKLLSTMSEAALYFADRYTRPDGTLIWNRDEWKGMDGSDDAYESVYNFPLLYALGGDRRLLDLSHHLWEGITRQFTEYGQIHREFDGYYDWMHHGESSLYFYYLSLAGRYGETEHQRAIRFANFYTGDDPEAPNYDRALRLIRSPLNGSRGPRLATTAEDWAELRGIYSQYPAPFTDIPKLHGYIADWTDPVVFEELLAKFNTHIARGDVPLNLIATTLVTHAFLATGDERYRQWVLDYLAAWVERTARNDGIMPDNVGLSGKIGEYNNGKWWGGYYGWGWPHGGRTLLEAAVIAGMNAALLTGDFAHLDLFRSQFEWLWGQGREVNGRWHLPFWREDSGWRSYRAFEPHLLIAMWSMTQREEDRIHIEDMADRNSLDIVNETGWGDESNALAWYRYVTGHLPDFPEQVLQSAYRHVVRRLQYIQSDPIDPHDWPPVTPYENDVHQWLNRNPVTCEALVQTMWGAPMPVYHGGLLHAQLRYFDEAEQRAGLPADVAALVETIDAGGLVLRLVNLDPLQSKVIIVQAGSFAEHTLLRMRDLTTGQVTEVKQPVVRIELAPAASLHARIEMQRLSQTPHYTHPV
jgi:hypothetical protein